MNATTTAFGSVLRQFREAAGLSQERLAERAGLNLRGISDLERGARSTPRLETVRMLEDALELTSGEREELFTARNAHGVRRCRVRGAHRACNHHRRRSSGASGRSRRSRTRSWGKVRSTSRWSVRAESVSVKDLTLVLPGDAAGAVGCFDLLADIAACRGDVAHAAWCIGVGDRIHRERSLARTDPAAVEHSARVEAMVRTIGEPAWRTHWLASYREDVQAGLDTGFAWGKPGVR